ncbi:hypothetical protein [Phaeacidiphilus oryzae]|uniref:hypothetical protein n=1 Tax=Phaeacidiphilus oryzae TaxID=348818 RepID=UPI000561E155|nr:hypothetical protein [Phaeacidiphilus oryzae]
MATQSTPGNAPQPRQRRGALEILFDLRVIIAMLFAVYGLVCLICGLVDDSAAELQKTGGIHLNLWAGVGMLIGAALFALWSFARPLTRPVPQHEDAAAES